VSWIGDRALQNLRDLVAQPEPGDVVAGRFELGERIGEGGMGVVHAGVDRETGRDVAVKIVRLTAEHDEARFDREVSALARVTHPSVVRYIAHGMHGATPYLVMDRLRGMTLAERLVRESMPLSMRESVDIVRSLAEGLAAVHAQGVTHRDLKPTNVFLVDGSSEHPRLLDFGLARLTDTPTLTQAGALVGTPGYMAPEQVRGDRAGAAADVFALGAILHECVARRPAFAAETTAALFAQILLEQPTSLDAFGVGAPKPLAELATRMMDKDPSRRPSAEEVAGALARLASELRSSSDEGIAPGLVEGQIVAGKYRIERRLGEGGMGIVVAARHLDLGTRVALKLMRGSERGDQARFLREAQAASRLESEHVARVTDVGRTGDGSPYMVMEYLNGVDLAVRLREGGPLPIAKAVDYVLQACKAIAEAHALGIVHRDLKPSNLFLVTRRDGSEIVKVLDFGISKMTKPLEEASRDITMTDARVVLGSIAYMSPEQLQASSQVDARSDIWSLGIVLYELLTGARPFDGDSAAVVGARIAAAEPPRLRERLPTAPASLEATVLRCLEKRPEQRFADLGELARALAPHGAEASHDAVDRVGRLVGDDSSATSAPAPPAARRRWPVGALSLLAFAGGAAAAVAFAVADGGDVRPLPSASTTSIGSTVMPEPPPPIPEPAVDPSSPAPSGGPPVSSGIDVTPQPRPSSPPRRADVKSTRPTHAPTASPAANAPAAPLSAPTALDLHDPALEGR